MNLNQNQTARIDLFDGEIGAFRQILRLANERLIEQPATQLRGCGGLERQAGMITPLLNNVRDMLGRLGMAFGQPLPKAVFIAPLTDDLLLQDDLQKMRYQPLVLQAVELFERYGSGFPFSDTPNPQD